MTPAAQRAIGWIEEQITALTVIRNATARDPSFKNWRQATLTAMQRIWPGDQKRLERFRRIPFSPVDPRADVRAVRESFSRGCQEAGRLLKNFIDEIEREGVPDGVANSNVVEPSDFEDGFPTVDLPLGDVVTARDPSTVVDDLMGDMGDLPPQGQDPSSPAPPRLPVDLSSSIPSPGALTIAQRIALEAAATAAAPTPAPAPPTLSSAPVPVSTAAGEAPRKGLNMKARLKDLLGFAQLSAKALAGFPREADEPVASGAPVAPEPIAIPVVVVTPPPTVAATPAPAESSAGATKEEVSAMLDAWPPRAANEPAQEAKASVVPIEPVAGPIPPPPAVVSGSDAAPALEESDAGFEMPSVIMSRPTTLRTNIEKVSIDSLISPEFREPETDAAGATVVAQTTPPAPVEEQPVLVSTPPVVEAPAVAEAPAPPVRPSLTLVPPRVLDDPEFMIDPTPSAELPKPVSQMPVPQLTPQATRSAERTPSLHHAPVPTVVTPPPSEMQDDESQFEDDMSDTPSHSNVDPEAFARATEDFMKSSPVLGATPRRVTRAPHDEHGFGDPDALAIASIIQELGDMGVPEARYAETRARLLDLARRLERDELDWTMLRKAVWFAMEYPDLARRLMPVLLPWMDRAA